MIIALDWLLLALNLVCLACCVSALVLLSLKLRHWVRLNVALWTLLQVSYGIQDNPRAMLVLAQLLCDAERLQLQIDKL